MPFKYYIWDDNLIHLYNDDCLNTMKSIEDKSVDLILTDPPYNLGQFMKDRQTNWKAMRDNFFVFAGWDNLSYEAWKELMDKFICESARVLKDGGTFVLFMGFTRIETITAIAEKYGFYYKTVGVWHKTNPTPRNMNLQFVNSTEAWMYFINKAYTGTFNNKGRLLHDFIEMPPSLSTEKTYGKHPTQKPLELMKYLTEILSNENDIVLDPFMGSGTVGVACKELNRNFIGIEISEEYYNVAKQRIDNAVTKTSLF